jgi:hypothetical protein
MVIHASKEFTKWFRCKISLKGQPVEQGRLLDHWSADVVQLRSKRLVLFMNDANLWSTIVPMEKFMTLDRLLTKFLARTAEVWARHGAPFDAANQSLYFLKRSNRSLVGSMNEAIHLIHAVSHDEGANLSWPRMEEQLNRMLYSALNYHSPDRVMQRMLEALP